MLFINNKYTTWYNTIVNNAKNRNNDGYTEKHHIIPRALGGTNKKDNLVNLTAREHFVCHLLLTKMLDGKQKHKMAYALKMMVSVKNIGEGRYVPTSKMYEIARKNHKSAIKDTWTLEMRHEAAKRASIQWTGKKHKKDTIDKHKNKEWTDKAIANRLNNCLVAAAKRKGKPWNEKRAATGYVRPSDEIMAEANKERSAKLKGRKLSKGREGHIYPLENKKTCEHCGKKLVPGYYYRYHGDKCKKIR